MAELNHHAAKLDNYMNGSVSAAETALVWSENGEARSWAETLINRQILFDVLLPENQAEWKLSDYRIVLLPEGTKLSPVIIEALRKFVYNGGRVLTEGSLPSAAFDDDVMPLYELLGISEAFVGEELLASYLRFEELPGEKNPLQLGMQQTNIIAHRGHVTYVQPQNEAVRVLATLVPPFSPLESVGAPPERASLPVSRTDLPLVLEHSYGAGRVMYCAFSLGALLREFKLAEHEMLLANAINYLYEGNPLLSVTSYPGLQVTLFRTENELLLHLVNGAGRRPLAGTLPLHDIKVRLRTGTSQAEETVHKLGALLSGDSIDGCAADGALTFTVPRLEVWECIRIPVRVLHSCHGED